jgi:transcription factor SPT20
MQSLSEQQRQLYTQMMNAHTAQRQNQAARMNGALPLAQAQNTSPTPHAAAANPVMLQQQHTPQQPQQQTPRQSSPLHTNQPITSRSPMPPNTQTAAVQQVPHAQAQTYAGYTAAMQAQVQAQLQNQFNAAHLRPVMHGHPPHPQMVSQLANGGMQAGAMMPPQTQGTQDAAQAHAAAPMMTAAPTHYPMYNYAQMGINMQHGRVPQYGWPVNMRQGMPAANVMQQQMQMGAGKTVSGGMQGS